MKVLIIGNGIAGMSAAIEAAELDDEVILVSPVQSERTQSVMAAEGINAVVDTAEEDSVVWHANDTLESGCFLEKEEDVRNLCEKAPEHLKWLDEMGVLFDRNEDDTWKVKASGGQSRKRTVYSGDSIGKQIVTAMTQKCLEYEIKGKIEKKIGLYFYSALIRDEKCYGALFYNPESKMLIPVYADAVICATGGMNKLYGKTTGSELNDGYVTGKLFLIPESVRSEGWRLYYKNRSHSVYFMEEKYGTEGNLMSRDLVAREIAMCPGQVYLENAKESIPVTPAIHFFMGGIKVDGMHQTNIAGLYAVGEAASKYHGANCLGGNSLMAAVHSGRTAAHAVHEVQGQPMCEELFVPYIEHEQEKIDRMEQMSEYRGKYSATATLRKLMKIMSYGMDLIRDGEVLQDPMVSVYENYRLYPMAVLGKATLMSAVERRESRGAHFRKDFPGEKSEFMKCSVAEFKDERIRIYFEQESGEKGGAVR